MATSSFEKHRHKIFWNSDEQHGIPAPPGRASVLGITAGADPGFFWGGGALVSCSTSTTINKPHSFFGRIPVVLENRRSSHLWTGRLTCSLHLPFFLKLKAKPYTMVNENTIKLAELDYYLSYSRFALNDVIINLLAAWPVYWTTVLHLKFCSLRHIPRAWD